MSGDNIRSKSSEAKEKYVPSIFFESSVGSILRLTLHLLALI